MSHGSPSSAEADVVDAHLGEPLPVPLLAAVVLAALVLEDDDLLAPAVAKHLGRHGGATHQRRAHLDVVAVRAEENVLEAHGLARLGVHRLDADGLARLGAVLVAADAGDGVHVVRYSRVADGACPKTNKTLNIADFAGIVTPGQPADIQRRRELAAPPGRPSVAPEVASCWKSNDSPFLPVPLNPNQQRLTRRG